MKKIQLSSTGGYPLTQDTLEYMQASTEEMDIAMLGSVVSGNTPVILKGMVRTDVGADVTITDGYYYYAGRIIRFDGSTATMTGANIPRIAESQIVSGDLGYYDGVVRDSYTESVAIVTEGGDEVPDGMAAFFSYKYMKTYAQVLGEVARGPWTTVTVTAAGGTVDIDGTVKYKLDKLNNSVMIDISLVTTVASAVPASPGYLSVTVATVPVGMRPSVARDFLVPVRSGLSRIYDDAGGELVCLKGQLQTDGDIVLLFIKSATDIYTVSGVLDVRLD